MTTADLATFPVTDKRGAAAIESIVTGEWRRAGGSYVIRGHRCAAAWCDCPSFRFSSDQTCRHTLAALLLDQLVSEQAAF